MANPVDPGTFDVWKTDREQFDTATPKSGSTGNFDWWITDRLMFGTYVAVTAAVVAAGNAQIVHLSSFNEFRPGGKRNIRIGL